MNELPSIFKGLKVHKIKSRRRGNQPLGYEFTFQKESTQKWIDDKFDTAGKDRKAKAGSKMPDWYNPNYKNETTPEQLEEMQKIKEKALKQ